VICVATFFTDYPAVDWVLYFENTGVADTPIIENIQVLDVLFNKPLPGKTPWLLHQTNGAQTTPEDMETRKVPLADDEIFSMGGALGMSTGYDLPYFRIDMAGPPPLSLSAGQGSGRPICNVIIAGACT
jgi:hypothetical protein